MDNRIKHLETILVIVLGLIVIYWVADSRYVLWGALALGLAGIIIPPVAAGVHWAWMKLAHALGYVMSKVLLTLVYTLVVIPMGFFSRKKITMRLKQGTTSYFKERNYTYKKEDLENVW